MLVIPRPTMRFASLWRKCRAHRTCAPLSGRSGQFYAKQSAQFSQSFIGNLALPDSHARIWQPSDQCLALPATASAWLHGFRDRIGRLGALHKNELIIASRQRTPNGRIQLQSRCGTAFRQLLNTFGLNHDLHERFLRRKYRPKSAPSLIKIASIRAKIHRKAPRSRIIMSHISCSITQPIQFGQGILMKIAKNTVVTLSMF